jgi:hypothetical protein
MLLAEVFVKMPQRKIGIDIAFEPASMSRLTLMCLIFV